MFKTLRTLAQFQGYSRGDPICRRRVCSVSWEFYGLPKQKVFPKIPATAILSIIEAPTETPLAPITTQHQLPHRTELRTDVPTSEWGYCRR